MNDLAGHREGGLTALRGSLSSASKRGLMRKLADYTLGVVIVLVHLIMMSRQNEKLGLGVEVAR